MSNIVVGPLALIFRINIFTQKASVSRSVCGALSHSLYIYLSLLQRASSLPVVAGGATVVTALLRKYETDKTSEELPDQLTVRQLVCKNVIHLNSSSNYNKTRIMGCPINVYVRCTLKCPAHEKLKQQTTTTKTTLH